MHASNDAHQINGKRVSFALACAKVALSLRCRTVAQINSIGNNTAVVASITILAPDFGNRVGSEGSCVSTIGKADKAAGSKFSICTHNTRYSLRTEFTCLSKCKERSSPTFLQYCFKYRTPHKQAQGVGVSTPPSWFSHLGCSIFVAFW